MGTLDRTIGTLSPDLIAAGFSRRLQTFAFDYLPMSGYILLLIAGTSNDLIVSLSVFLDYQC